MEGLTERNKVSKGGIWSSVISSSRSTVRVAVIITLIMIIFFYDHQ